MKNFMLSTTPVTTPQAITENSFTLIQQELTDAGIILPAETAPIVERMIHRLPKHHVSLYNDRERLSLPPLSAIQKDQSVHVVGASHVETLSV